MHHQHRTSRLSYHRVGGVVGWLVGWLVETPAAAAVAFCVPCASFFDERDPY
jgi:hypothetical protein